MGERNYLTRCDKSNQYLIVSGITSVEKITVYLMIELAKNTLKQYRIIYTGELKIYDYFFIKFKNK
jgi:hypothetical protein